MECEASCSASKRLTGAFSASEKTIILNVFDFLQKENCSSAVRLLVEQCSAMTGVGQSSIFKLLRERQSTGRLSEPKKPPGKPKLEVCEDVKVAIRRKVHTFFFRNEPPTIQKVLALVNEDKSIPPMSSSTLGKVLREMKIRYKKRQRKSYLTERDDIINWRRRYLRQIRQYRQQNKPIFYLDETWLNEGHTRQRVWQDESITDRRQAFMEGWSTGLKNPSGKGRRLIITHVGGETGFVEDGLLVFESKKTGDYHEEMNASVFEDWFGKILKKLPRSSVIVMDNASYHSRKLERLPTSSWRKADIQNWLKSKCIPYETDMVKNELLEHCVKPRREVYDKYVCDEMAKGYGMTVLRLPPYHCELNPIELVWGQVKNEVGCKNTTFKLQDVKRLLIEALGNVTPSAWQNCIRHIFKEEDKMWELDNHIEITVEPLIISLADSDSGSSESDVSM